MSAAVDILHPARPKRVVTVASNPATSEQTGWPIGFWWAELTHPYLEFTEVRVRGRHRQPGRRRAPWRRLRRPARQVRLAREFPGHLGVEVFRPTEASAGEYRTVYRFDTPEHLRSWLDSDEHAAWLERAEPHVIGPMRASVVTGLETWFTLPSRPLAPPPPRSKMALLTWITIFPLITAIVVVTGPLLEGFPLVVRLGITTAIAVPLMTWVVMPRLTRLLHRLLFPRTRDREPATASWRT